MLASFFRSRSLLFCFVTLVRVVGILAMFMLVISQLLNIASNIKGYENRPGESGGSTSSSGEPETSIVTATSSLRTSFEISSGTRTRATATDPVNTSSRRRQAVATDADAPTTASEFVQPDATQEASISEAAQAQASRLNSAGESAAGRRKRSQLLKRAESNSDDSNGGSANFFPNTDVPKETGGLAFIVIERFITIFVLVFLLISEMAPPRVSAWYQRHFPPLGPDHGVGWLGILMVWIGAACLSHATSLNAKALKFQRVVSWMVFVIGLVNCAFGVFLFESIRPFRALLPSDQPQPDFESYSSTQGHQPPMRSLSANHNKEAQEEATETGVQVPAPVMTQTGPGSVASSTSSKTNRKSFKGFGSRKPSLGGIGSGLPTHHRTASAGGRLFNITSPRASMTGHHSSSRSVSGPPTYMSKDYNGVESLANDPDTAPAIKLAQEHNTCVRIFPFCSEPI